MGKKDILNNSELPMLPFSRNSSFHAIDLNEARTHRPILLEQLAKDVASMLHNRQIKPPKPIHVLGIGEVEDSFRYLQTGRNTGKTVVELRKKDIIRTLVKAKPSWNFDPKSTYVIAGGLGGIGRSTARWMAQRSARHLVLLSRSGVQTDEAIQLVKDLEAFGVQVATPQCDIAKVTSLSIVLQTIKTTMPPIRGCIQSAMVLRNKVFENMSHQDWKETVDSKVAGTWNLHHLLPKDMDFFIMFSSVAGAIGGTASVNYSAACTFQDAVAHYRNKIGEKATTINLGVMMDDGVLRDNSAVRDALIGTGYLVGISQKEMFALLDQHCDPCLAIPESPLKSQVIVGIDAPLSVQSRGAEIPTIMSRPLFRGTWNLAPVLQSPAKDGEVVTDVLEELANASVLGEAGQIISFAIMRRLSKSLGVPIENLDSSKALHGYGVDSLVAVELRNWFNHKLDADIPAFEIMGDCSFDDVGVLVAEKSRVVASILNKKVM